MGGQKTVILGVTGSIAAYKAAYLAGLLVKSGIRVHVIMTENAAHFITPLTFETLTGNKCLMDTFDRNFQYNVGHVALAKKADAVMIAPATANVIAKLAHGLADDMLTTTVLACKCPKLIAPAMNTAMYENPVTRNNLSTLKGYGYTVINPEVGRLACGDTGAGKMPEPAILAEYIMREVADKKDLKGKKILITAGPTKEAIDPVRYVTNHSTGKMGYALAKACARRGALVTLVTGPVNIEEPLFVKTVHVTTAKEMFLEVREISGEQDIIIKAAAVADYRPKHISGQKIKKTDKEQSLLLEKTDDILAYLGEHKEPGQFLCGFSMETEHLLDNSMDKLKRKNLDMIVANALNVPGAGFAGDTNVVTIITKDEEMSLPLMTKEEVAERILDKIADLLYNQQ